MLSVLISKRFSNPRHTRDLRASIAFDPWQSNTLFPAISAQSCLSCYVFLFTQCLPKGLPLFTLLFLCIRGGAIAVCPYTQNGAGFPENTIQSEATVVSDTLQQHLA